MLHSAVVTQMSMDGNFQVRALHCGELLTACVLSIRLEARSEVTTRLIVSTLGVVTRLCLHNVAEFQSIPFVFTQAYYKENKDLVPAFSL